MAERRRFWLGVGAGLPVCATLSLLWTDIFNLSELVLGRLAAGHQGVVRPAQNQATGLTQTVGVPTQQQQPAEGPDVALLPASCRLVDSLDFAERWQRSLSQRRKPGSSAEARSPGGPGRRQVGASIAVHPPKYYAVSRFLEDWYFCPAAFEALAVVLVFTKEADLALFKEAQACLSPEVPDDAWTGVVAQAPKGGWYDGGGSSNQLIAAYKKWYGIAHMMDLGPEAPRYGMMLDSEVVLYDNHAKDKTGQECAPGGAWSGLLGRLQAREAAKLFPAAVVSDTFTTYDFGTYKRSGQDYDRLLINENARFVKMALPEGCSKPGCAEVVRQEKECLFSWWTDLPWLSIQVAKRMLRALAGSAAVASFRNLACGIRFPRFEYMAYQQWCVIQEGFHFRDVTNLTGKAKWGSYLEDPLPGARISELQPLWISTKALEQAERGSIPKMPPEAPPLLIFHADHGGPRFFNRLSDEKSLWEDLVLRLLRQHGRADFDQNSIKL